ncbi:MAG: hypothetical protein VKN60_05550 [Cyanobacteriota bacterium]|nr:hypothetical protein [Cyanobacteriota bacterium]
MNSDPYSPPLPAPCVIDRGLLVQKEDMKRVLNSLSRVRYRYTLEDLHYSEGEGWILAVFADPAQATIVVNQSLYINVQSFDYLKLTQVDQQSVLTLVQDSRQLELTPLAAPTPSPTPPPFDAAALEAVLTQVLSAHWDVQLDDDFF